MMNYFPPKAMLGKWLQEGLLTGEPPKRMRRRKCLPDGSLPEPGEG
jgi:hypothetical protein